MLSDFVNKLLFTHQLSLAEGRIEVLGQQNGLFSHQLFVRLQENPQSYTIFKEAALQQMKAEFKQLGLAPEITYVKQVFELFGFGRMDIIDLDPKQRKAIVHIAKSPFVDYCVSSRQHPAENCRITAALIAGTLSFLFSADMDAIEQQCSLQGKGYCEFIVKEARSS